MVAQPALAVSSQRRSIEQYPFYDKTAEQICDNGNVGVPGNQVPTPGGGVYFVGDSIGEGLLQAGLKSQLENAGYQALINADRSRSITGKGQTTKTSGLDALNSNASFIQTAKIVIVELGTNPEAQGNFAANLDTLISRIAGINGEAKIYFIDVAASPAAASRLNSAAANSAIYDRAAKLGTPVISRFKLYYPSANPQTYEGATSPVLPFDSLGVHSATTADYQKLNEVILSTLGKPLTPTGSSTVCICPSQPSASSGVTNLTGANNLEKAYNFFISKGLTPEQTAGAIGNMMQESSTNLDPQLVEGGGRSQDPLSAGGKGYGIIQWTPGSKLVNVARTAGITGPIYELNTQLEVVWWHMGNTSPTGFRNMLTRYKTITSVEEAVQYFEEKIEAAGIKVIQKRIAYARQVLARFGAGTPGVTSPEGASPAPATSNGCIPASTTGGASEGSSGGFTLSNVQYYNQCDPAWGSKAYSSSTICKSGCGPTSLAIAISTLNKTRILPEEVANYSASRGFYIPGQGTSWAAFTEVPKQYGLKGRNIGKNLDEAKKTLAAGGLVIASFGPGHFTGGGHILVIRSIDANGKIFVADPNDSKDLRKSNTAWDPSIIMGESKNFWAITK